MLTETQSQEKFRQVLQLAQQLYRQDPDWVTFFREILGVDGVIRKSFLTMEELCAFERSESHDEIQKLLVKLREKRSATDSENEPTRVITVRLPKSMHEFLRTEAHDRHTSMNKLCISKLLQMIDQEKIPSERTTTSPRRKVAIANTAPLGQAPAATTQTLGGQQPMGTQQPLGMQQPKPMGSTFQSQPAPSRNTGQQWNR